VADAGAGVGAHLVGGGASPSVLRCSWGGGGPPCSSMAGVGVPLTDTRLRRSRPNDPGLSPGHRSRHDPWAHECPGREREHQVRLPPRHLNTPGVARLGGASPRSPANALRLARLLSEPPTDLFDAGSAMDRHHTLTRRANDTSRNPQTQNPHTEESSEDPLFGSTSQRSWRQ
jgi:hypothetical protein